MDGKYDITSTRIYNIFVRIVTMQVNSFSTCFFGFLPPFSSCITILLTVFVDLGYFFLLLFFVIWVYNNAVKTYFSGFLKYVKFLLRLLWDLRVGVQIIRNDHNSFLLHQAGTYKNVNIIRRKINQNHFIMLIKKKIGNA